MASASSSTSIPPPRACTYHVFLSFRGEDTRTGFTSHLYAALNRKGITTYKDDQNLRKGHVISDELLRAIEESMFAVIVFSQDYASSSWCLDELQKIIECNNKLGIQIEAVFYGVKPCDVRHQRGTFEEAFKKHEQRHDSEKVQRWREALKQVASYSGWSSKNQDEAALVESIAQHIFEILIPKLPSSMKNLVGIKSRVEQVITQIGLGLNDVRCIGIWGMGGIGKTTIARAVFETIRSRFEVTCFLADVREQCEKKDITHIQKQLLDQMNISSNGIYNKYDGMTKIQNSLRHKKVLLVLDDVNHKKQLEDLAGEEDLFGPGSRIIITTRDVEVLKGQEVHETCKIEGLVESEAFNLFCLKAFKQLEPIEGFLDLSKKVVKYSGGLPLALKVLGSYLNGRPIAVWHSAIEKIKKFSHSEIIDVLKISYDGLDSMEKNIFLDIACFFKGHEKDYVTKILEGCGHDAEIGIDILINRSLVTISDYGILGMHDLLEEMGKLIVIQESPNDVSKRSRLWCYEDVDFVLTQKKETEATHSIVLSYMFTETEGDWRDLSFSNICQLKLLILDYVEATINFDIPCTLKVLHWKRCPMETLGFTNQHYELVDIDLSRSNIIQLWEGNKVLKKLEHLNLSGCKNLKQVPDLSGALNLKTLNLEECWELNYIHRFLTHHNSLVELNLMGCDRSLDTLVEKLEMSSLKELDLSKCSSLRRLPDLSGAPKLKTLNLEKCDELNDIHPSLVEHKSIIELNLRKCVRLETLADKLEMSSLEKLDLFECSSLRRLADLSGAPNLKTLNLQECRQLNYTHPSLAHHKSLVELNLGGCIRLETLAEKLEMSSLEKLYLEFCSSLRRVPEFGECMKKLSILTLKYTGIEEPPTSLGNLAGVSELDLTGCHNLTSLPLSLGCFVGLKKLVLNRLVELSCVPNTTHGLQSLTIQDYSDSPNIVGLLCSLSRLTSLSTLKLQGCFRTSTEESSLSYDHGHLASLTDLDLSYNWFLRVPISIHELPRLTRLKLWNCCELEVLPELPSSLRELHAGGCCSLDASNVDDVISKACCGFAESASQDREDLLQMLVTGKEIPAWFEDQEEDNGVSVSFPSTETIALALSFLFEGKGFSNCLSVICNNKEFINTSLFNLWASSDNLCIVCVNGYYLSNLVCQHNRFQIVLPNHIRVKRSGARWVCKQDIQDFNKNWEKKSNS